MSFPDPARASATHSGRAGHSSSRAYRQAHGPAAAALILILITLMLQFGAATARADIGETIIDRCTNGKSLKGFSQAAYRQALKDISAGTEEYSTCAQLIREAQLEAAAGRGAPSTSAGAAPSQASVIATTSAERQAIARAPTAGAAPVQVGGQAIHPGVVHVDIASAISSLPTPLLATLAFLLVGLLVAAGADIRKRIAGIRRSR